MKFDRNLITDLVRKFVSVTLSNRTVYTTRFTLQSVPVDMFCEYNSRNKMRSIILTTAEGVVILPQTYIKYKRRCELNFNATQYDLSYYVTLKPKDLTKTVPESYDYVNWGEDFELCFVGYEQSLEDRLESNYIAYSVSNQ